MLLMASCVDGRPAPQDLLLQLAQPSRVMTSTDEHHIEKLAAMLQIFLRTRFLNFLRGNTTNPINISFQSDATPTKATERFVGKLGGERVLRSGFRTGEYLLHRCVARTAGGRHMALMEEPRRIADKTTSTHLSVAESFLLYPFKYGCRGTNVVHTVFDGALYAPLSSGVFQLESFKTTSAHWRRRHVICPRARARCCGCALGSPGLLVSTMHVRSLFDGGCATTWAKATS